MAKETDAQFAARMRKQAKAEKLKEAKAMAGRVAVDMAKPLGLAVKLRAAKINDDLTTKVVYGIAPTAKAAAKGTNAIQLRFTSYVEEGKARSDVGMFHEPDTVVEDFELATVRNGRRQVLETGNAVVRRGEKVVLQAKPEWFEGLVLRGKERTVTKRGKAAKVRRITIFY